jgi:hypothetical protein
VVVFTASNAQSNIALNTCIFCEFSVGAELLKHLMHMLFTNQSLFPLCERQYIFVAADFGLSLVGE